MILSLLAVEAVLDAFMDLLILDPGVDSVKSSIVIGRSASLLPMFLLRRRRVGTSGC